MTTGFLSVPNLIADALELTTQFEITTSEHDRSVVLFTTIASSSLLTRQLEEIVREARSNAPVPRRMPPVLDIALDELLGGRSEQVFPGELAPGGQQRDDVLELVAEAVRATGLIERGSRPQPAAAPPVAPVQIARGWQ